MNRPLHSFILAALAMVESNAALAQCQNAAQPSCDVYDSCFAKYCPCKGDANEYFLTYGKKYCTNFLNIEVFTAAGKKWRDSTLVCLQEGVVPKLDISVNPQCNCSAMRQTAFDLHVSCYTQLGASICDLPIADVNEIRKTIDLKDLFNSSGWKQMREVAAICAIKAPDDGRRTAWKGAEAVLKLR